MTHGNLIKLIKRMMEFRILLSTKKNVLTTFLKNLLASNNISEETRRSLKPVGTRPGIMYRLCKVPKDIIDNCPPFRPCQQLILLPIN